MKDVYEKQQFEIFIQVFFGLSIGTENAKCFRIKGDLLVSFLIWINIRWMFCLLRRRKNGVFLRFF